MTDLLAAFGDFLPVALAVALGPFPIVAIVVVAAQPAGIAAGVGLLAGWAASLSALALLFTFAVGELDGLGLRNGGAWVQIAIGLLLVAAAVAKWRGRPRGDAAAPIPGWMRPLAAATPGRAALYGLALGANPKNIALTAAAAAGIAYRGLSGPAALVAVALYVALASSTMIGAILARALGGEPAARRLEGVKGFMLRHNAVVMMVVLLFLGLKILGDGLASLGP